MIYDFMKEDEHMCLGWWVVDSSIGRDRITDFLKIFVCCFLVGLY